MLRYLKLESEDTVTLVLSMIQFPDTSCHSQLSAQWLHHVGASIHTLIHIYVNYICQYYNTIQLCPVTCLVSNSAQLYGQLQQCPVTWSVSNSAQLYGQCPIVPSYMVSVHQLCSVIWSVAIVLSQWIIVICRAANKNLDLLDKVSRPVLYKNLPDISKICQTFLRIALS